MGNIGKEVRTHPDPRSRRCHPGQRPYRRAKSRPGVETTQGGPDRTREVYLTPKGRQNTRKGPRNGRIGHPDLFGTGLPSSGLKGLPIAQQCYWPLAAPEKQPDIRPDKKRSRSLIA